MQILRQSLQEGVMKVLVDQLRVASQELLFVPGQLFKVVCVAHQELVRFLDLFKVKISHPLPSSDGRGGRTSEHI